MSDFIFKRSLYVNSKWKMKVINTTNNILYIIDPSDING